MRISLLLLLLCTAVLQAQSLIEDFRCRLAAGVATGTITTVTCDQPHNFGGRHAMSRLSGVASVTEGKQAIIDGVTYTFRANLNNAAPGEVRIGSTGMETATNLFNAINDTGAGKGSAYSSATTAHATCSAFRPSGASVLVQYRTAGPAGHGIPVSANSPLGWNSSTLLIQWFVMLSGANGSWSAFGSDTTPKYYTATYVTANSFSVPFNSNALTPQSFAGQVVSVRRASGDGSRMFYPAPTVQGDIREAVTDEATLAITIPACADSNDEAACSRGYWNPDNQKAYMKDQKIQSFVVSGGVATITLTAPYVDGGESGFEPLEAGRLIHIRGMQQYATAANPGYAGAPNAPPQTEAAHMAKNSTRGYRVQSLSPDKTILTIHTALANGSYTLSCLPAGSCIGRTQNEGYIAITWRSSPLIYFRPRDTSGYLYPNGYLHYHVKQGEFDPLANRLRMWVKWGVNNPRSESGGLDFNIGTYPQTAAQDALGSGSHFYHYYNFSAYDGVWQQIEMTAAPSHQVGAGGGILWPNEPLRGHIFYPPWPGGARSYMEGLTILYLDPVGYKGPWDGQTMHLAGLAFDRTDNEPEELVRGRSIVYSPKRFIGGILTESAGYDVSWEAVPVSGLTYEVRYSTTQSLKSLGFSNGQGSTIVTPPGVNAGLNGAWWVSPAMSQQENFYAAIRPRVPVSGVTGAGQSPIWVVTRASLGVQAGDTVTVSGVGGNTAANQTAASVAAVKPRKFWWRFEPQVANGWSIPGKLASITSDAGVCTAQFTENHDLPPGWLIEVQGSTNAVLGSIPALAPKLYTVASVPTPQSFIFNCAGVANGVYNTDYSNAVHLAIQAFPGVGLSGTGNGGWTGGGVITSDDEYKNFAEVHYAPYVTTGTPPQPPANLAASAASSSAINLSWDDPSAGVASVRIERKQGSGGVYSEIALVEPGTATYSATGLLPATTYFFRARATNSSGTSSYGNEASASTIDPTAPPPAPTQLSAADASADHILLTWQDNAANETGYEVEMDAGTGFARVATAPANATEWSSYPALSLEPSRVYGFRVRAINSFGTSAYSAQVNPATLAPLPARLAAPPTPDSVVVHMQAPTTEPCQIRAGSALSSEPGPDGVRSRSIVVGGLLAEELYSLVVKCGSIASKRFEVATPANAPAGGTFTVLASRPVQAIGADNFLIDYGGTAENLNQTAAFSCSSAQCSAQVEYQAGWIAWVSRRWCRNRASDPGCALPANMLARSKPEAVVVGQP